MRREAETQLKKTLEDLQRSNRDLEQFAYIASHDLQEPLRMVGSYVQLLSRRYGDRLDADASEFIQYAVDGAQRMQRLISDLLAYSRVGTRGKPFKNIDCTVILKHVLADLSMAITEAGATITYDPLPTIPVDEIQLRQLLQNLILNAIKFHGNTPPLIHISARRRDGEWVFSVRDNGIGIDPRHFQRIFLIFQRLHGPGEYQGTGIGLAIAKKIVERHGGEIWVESEPGKGAEFFFTLPDRRPV
jgi:light-regulated signal transduction histidine kinase (bacteriophytochrome)